MKRPANTGLFLLIYGFCSILYANDIADEEKPSLEFLEFLGSFESDNGQWVDPMEIENMLKLSMQGNNTKEKDDEKNIMR